MKRSGLTVILLLLILTVAGMASATPIDSKDGAVAISDPPITVGQAWTNSGDVPPSFYWSSGSPPLESYSDPFTYTSSGVTSVYVEDGGCVGHMFDVYDNGVRIGTTSAVTATSECNSAGWDPEVIWANDKSSKGCFTIPASGEHSIELVTIQVYEPLSGGQGYIQVLDGYCPGTTPAPEFPTTLLPALMIIGFLGAVFLIQRTREH